MSIIGEDALTRAVSLCFPPADRLHHNNQAVLLKWNFPSVPQKGRLSCEYIRSLFKVTGCWWRLFYMSKKKLFAVDLCSVTSLSSCYLFSDVSPGSSSVWTLTLRGFLLYEKSEYKVNVLMKGRRHNLWNAVIPTCIEMKRPSEGCSLWGNKDTLHSRRQVIVGFASPRPTFQFYTLLLLKWFSQRAITGHVPVKTT